MAERERAKCHKMDCNCVDKRCKRNMTGKLLKYQFNWHFAMFCSGVSVSQHAIRNSRGFCMEILQHTPTHYIKPSARTDHFISRPMHVCNKWNAFAGCCCSISCIHSIQYSMLEKFSCIRRTHAMRRNRKKNGSENRQAKPLVRWKVWLAARHTDRKTESWNIGTWFAWKCSYAGYSAFLMQ